jgi:hypothetical protein
MTEAEWITTKLPLYMLRECPAEWDLRKVRLFWCACVRRTWDQLTDEGARQLVEEVELHPEADTDWFERERSFVFEGYDTWSNKTHSGLWLDSWVFDTFRGIPPDSLRTLLDAIVHRLVGMIANYPSGPLRDMLDAAEAAVKTWQSNLIREVFGNPFRPVHAEPAWLTSDVLLLARGIYDEKAFDRMPILADALQDAGCDNMNVLDHCREEREHVRGCWVIDMLLGKG